MHPLHVLATLRPELVEPRVHRPPELLKILARTHAEQVLGLMVAFSPEKASR